MRDLAREDRPFDDREALAVFEHLGARGPKHDAYRVIGMVYRETGRHALAESIGLPRGALEHTAPLAPGSSGSPLADASGRVVGINTSRIGGGFYLALPTDAALRARVDALVRGDFVDGRAYTDPAVFDDELRRIFTDGWVFVVLTLDRNGFYSGKPWPDVFDEALAAYPAETSQRNHVREESFYDAASRLGFIGCIKETPPDLSTNPKYMDGFGKRDS